MHGIGRFDPGKFEKSRRKVDVYAQVGVYRTGFDQTGIADEKRHADGGLENQALVVKSVLTEPIPLIGGVDHDRVLGQLFLIQIIKDSLQVVVIAGHASGVLVDHVLVSDANFVLVALRIVFPHPVGGFIPQVTIVVGIALGLLFGLPPSRLIKLGPPQKLLLEIGIAAARNLRKEKEAPGAATSANRLS